MVTKNGFTISKQKSGEFVASKHRAGFYVVCSWNSARTSEYIRSHMQHPNVASGAPLDPQCWTLTLHLVAYIIANLFLRHALHTPATDRGLLAWLKLAIPLFGGFHLFIFVMLLFFAGLIASINVRAHLVTSRRSIALGLHNWKIMRYAQLFCAATI